jgi:hypothetical protein
MSIFSPETGRPPIYLNHLIFTSKLLSPDFSWDVADPEVTFDLDLSNRRVSETK